MKNKLDQDIERKRLTKENCKIANFPLISDSLSGCNGLFIFPRPSKEFLICLVSNQLCWDHVSISINDEKKKFSRLPTWEEMNFVKRAFWEDDETVVQFHPKKSQYVNIGQVLHLWKKQNTEYELPPAELI